jgi:hypothetical protein
MTSAAHRWLLTLGTIHQREHVPPTAILVQAAEDDKPTHVQPNGQQWRFWDGSTLEIDDDGVRAMPAIAREGTT